MATMKAVTEAEIRASFVNCTQGEAKRLAIPRDLPETPWDDLDFLGWRDPAAPDRGYIVAEHAGRLVGVALRQATAQRGFLHSGLCSVCLTQHSGTGVGLMTARKAGTAGRQGNSVGLHICSDLACSLYIRGRKQAVGSSRFEETLSVEEQVDRAVVKLASFLDKLDLD